MNPSDILWHQLLKGGGEQTFILLHNAGGDHQFLEPQVKTLQAFGDVLLLDLPGHGQSGPLARYTMHDLSSIIYELSLELKLEQVSLVGLNNGANIAIDMATRHPESLKSLILIDPPLFLEDYFVDELNQSINELQSDKRSDFIDSLTENLFIKTSQSNKDLASSTFKSVEPDALSQVFEGLLDWDKQSGEKLSELNYPCLCVLTDEHHCSMDKIKSVGSHFDIGKVVGSKCWATLEVPEQVNAMIRRFLTLNP